jgi:hypothetical protein
MKASPQYIRILVWQAMPTRNRVGSDRIPPIQNRPTSALHSFMRPPGRLEVIPLLLRVGRPPNQQQRDPHRPSPRPERVRDQEYRRYQQEDGRHAVPKPPRQVCPPTQPSQDAPPPRTGCRRISIHLKGSVSIRSVSLCSHNRNGGKSTQSHSSSRRSRPFLFPSVFSAVSAASAFSALPPLRGARPSLRPHGLPLTPASACSPRPARPECAS